MKIRYTGKAPTSMPDYGEIKPGVFDCPEELGKKLLAAGKVTGDYVSADAASSPEDATLAAQIARVEGAKPWAEDFDPAEKRKERK